MTPLPIDAALPDLLAKLPQTGAVVLQAPTGAGKTTRVPPALLNDKLVLVLEPRRVAARAAARRMAFENGSPLSEVFGYHVRLDRKVTPRTRCIVLTPGILLRYLQDDPFLEAVGTIVFDEFHERGLDSDLVLGMVKLLRQTVRPDLRAVVMSATLDTASVASYLGNCHVSVSEGRSYPVTIRYQPRRREAPMTDAVAAAVGEILDSTPGDVLVFLPGLGEIRRVQERLRSLEPEFVVLPLHGDLPPDVQDRALQKMTRRKIVLATNVAETSVTVDGVTAVIDSGQSRQMEFDTGCGMNRLRLAPISKASADQRAGRAGRTQPGVCVRLWDEPSHAARPAQTVPEVLRSDLAPAVLQLIDLGEDVSKFPWLDAPKPEAIENAMILLERLGAVGRHDGFGVPPETAEHSMPNSVASGGTPKPSCRPTANASLLTPLGKTMAALPVHPRIARMLVEGEALGVTARAALAAAVLSERDPFDRESLRTAIPTDSDLVDRIEALDEYERVGRTQFPLGTLHRMGADSTLAARDQLLRLLPKPSMGKGSASHEPLLRAIFTAFPDRLCRRRNRNDRRALMVGGRGVWLAPSSGVIEPDLFVATDVDAGDSEAVVRQASEVKREWLTTTAAHELEFDETSRRVVCWKRSRFNGLTIDETPGHIRDAAAAERLLCAAAERHWEDLQPPAESAAGQFLIRWRNLRSWWPDCGLMAPTSEGLAEQLCRGCRSFDDIRRADWLGGFKQSLSWPEFQTLEREVPASYTVPSGREVPLVYESDRPPVLAAKIQELFGLAETPRIAGGRVKLLIHLLSPNGRPQQVTDDLASFWANTYSVIRKELRGRYPKHDWPEDPTTAVASKGVRKRVP